MHGGHRLAAKIRSGPITARLSSIVREVTIATQDKTRQDKSIYLLRYYILAFCKNIKTKQ